MEKRKLGLLEVSSLGLGCMGMSEYYGVADEEEALKTIHTAIDMGITMLDTADMYGLGRNEELVGKAIKYRRDEVVIATKFGNERNFNGQLVRINGTPAYAKAACDASMRRLGTDYIDLLYLHRVDPKVPIEDTIGAMSDLVRLGKVRAIGLSEASAATIRRAHKIHPISALQTEYSLWSRDVEDEILPVCRELGIGFVAYSPLGRGFLTGAIKDTKTLDANDFRLTTPRFQGENFKRNRTFVERFEDVARSKFCQPSQLALAWLLAKGKDIVPIPGTKRQTYLEENMGATAITLSPEDIHRIEEAIPREAIAGQRYAADRMKRLNL